MATRSIAIDENPHLGNTLAVGGIDELGKDHFMQLAGFAGLMAARAVFVLDRCDRICDLVELGNRFDFSVAQVTWRSISNCDLAGSAPNLVNIDVFFL
jgi:hypothetical protein